MTYQCMRSRSTSTGNRSIFSLFSFVISLQLSLLGPLPAHAAHPPKTSPAQTGGLTSSGVSTSAVLDLSSSIRALSAGSQLSGPVNIREGGTRRTISATDLLTPAELVAFQEVLSTGHQTLVLSSSGTATGGSFQLTPGLSQSISTLVIPKGVTAVDNFASNGNLNLSGNLTNDGRFYAVSSSPSVSTASITATNIFNEQGAVFTSVLPKSGLPAMSNLLSNLNLSFNASNSFVNSGTVSSAGSLTVTASNSITNALPAAATGANPVMQAVNNVNLQAPSIVNAGLISSQLAAVNANTAQLVNAGTIQAPAGSVQIANLSGNSLTVDNSLGTITAQDQVLFETLGSTSQSKAELSVVGGTISANNVSFVSPDGHINVATDRINGAVDVSGGSAEVGAKQGNLDLASVQLTGDPLFYAQGGNLDLSGLFTSGSTYSTAGGDFVALATGNITATTAPSAATVDASSTSGQGGAIALYAGFNFTVDPTQTGCSSCSHAYSVGGPSSTGGSINLPAVSFRSNNNVTVQTTGTFTATAVNANGLGNANGGSIAITAQTVQGTAAGPLTLSANGAGTGNGGFIHVNTIGDLTVGLGAGNLIISATGGSPGSLAGNGGNVSLNVGQSFPVFIPSNLTIDPSALNVGPIGTNGNGGFLSLIPSINANGTVIFINGSVLNLNGVGNGNGGGFSAKAIALQAPVARAFTVTANGAGTGSGGGISLSLSSNFTIGFGPGDFIFSATGGSPGSLSGSGGGVGIETFANVAVDPAALNVAPLGNNGGGGSIVFNIPFINLSSLNNPQLRFVAAGALNANGVGNGNGGFISLVAQDLVGPPSGPLTVSANGGRSGGEIQVTVFANSFTIGSGPGNFIISATGGSAGSSGDGGTFVLRAGSPPNAGANVTLDPKSLNLEALGTNGNGGNLFITIDQGNMNIVNTGLISANGVGSGNGGIINLFFNPFFNSGNVPLQISGPGPVTLAANGAGSGSGGSITLNVQALSFGTGAGPLTLAANGGSAGNGGSILLSSQSGDLHIGSGAGNVVISATGGSSGSSSGDGGSVQVSTGGNLSLDPAWLSVSPLGTNGNSGSINLSANAALNIVNTGLINSSGAGNGFGGQISISCATLQLTGAGPVTLAANGAGNGSGGSIMINATQAFLFGNAVGPLSLTANGGASGNGGNISISTSDSLAVGPGAGDLIVSATGGSAGSPAGNGGSVQLGGGNITLNPASLNVTPLGTNGNGGSILLITPLGGPPGLGTVTIINGGVINASGVGNGNGGSITINAQSLQVAAPGPVTVAANGGGTGNGGLVGVVSPMSNLVIGSGTGDLVISATGGSAGSSSGNGGSVLIGVPGLTLDPASLNVAPLGTNGNGGTISILPPSGGPPPPPPPPPGGPPGGPPPPPPGGPPGGAVTIINGGVINASGVGNGNGGSITINAQSLQVAAPGPVTLAGNGGSTGNGGNIVVSANAGFTIGSGAGDLIISATGGSSGSTSGNGGSVQLSGGNITLDPASLNVTPLGTNGNGGSIILSPLGGPFGGPGTGPGAVTIINGGVINASGVGNGNGGSINILAQTLQVIAPGPVPLAANGAGTGNGGSVEVLTLTGNLAIGSGTGALVVSATGGSAGSSSGNGGFVLIGASDLTLDPASLNVAPLGTNGNGGSIAILPPPPPPGGPPPPPGGPPGGAVTIINGGVINASAVGNGNGGSIHLVGESNASWQVSGANPLTLAANGAGNGNAGSISVQIGPSFAQGTLQVTGAGGLTLQATGVSNGNAGSIILPNVSFQTNGNSLNLTASGPVTAGAIQAPGGNVTVNAGGAFTATAVNVDAVGNGNGGSITIFAQTLQGTPAGPLLVSANGAGTGGGGNINLTVSGDLTVASGPGAVVISATGGSPGSTSGDGGSVNVVTSGNLALDPAALNVAPLGANGNGGSILLEAGAGQFVGTINIANPGVLNASGVGNGNGGFLAILAGGTLQSPAAGPVTLVANGSGEGSGGTILVFSGSSNLAVGPGDGDFLISATGGSHGSPNGNGGVVNLGTLADLTVDLGSLNVAPLGANGNGGVIVLSAHYGTLSITDGSLINANGVGNANGGFIGLDGHTLQLPTLGPFTLLANGAGTGNGGFVSVVDTGGNLAVGSKAGDFIASATGGSIGSSSGNGGGVAFLASGNLTVDLVSLHVAPLGINGNGGIIVFTSFSGTLSITDGSLINANGVGNGNGGFINLLGQTLQFPASGPVTLAANGAGSGSGGTVFVRTTNSSAAGGDLVLGTKGHDLLISVAGGSLGGPEGVVNISAGGNLTINEGARSVVSFLNPNDLIITGSNLVFHGAELDNAGSMIVAQAFNLTSNGGPLTLSNSGSIQAASLKMLANGGSATLDNDGFISTSGQVQLTSNGGSSIITGAGSLSAGGGINVISNTGSVDVSQGSISGLVTGSAAMFFSVATTFSGLSAGNITAQCGSISLRAGTGVLGVAEGSALNATQGNITLLDTSNGSIVIGSNAQLVALAGNKSMGGNIFVVVGPMPTTFVKGTTPGNVNATQQKGGMVYFGANPITVLGSNNNFTAIGSNIVINNGGTSASSITFNGGDYLKADPPSGVQEMPDGAKVMVSTSGTHGQPDASSVNVFASKTYIPDLSLWAQASTGSQLSPPTSSTVTPVDTMPGTDRTGDDTRVLPADLPDNGGTLIPIAFVSPTAAGIQTFQTFKTGSGTTLVKHSGYARVVEREPGVLTLYGGDILVAAAEPTTVALGSNTLALAAGSVALVSMSENSSSIRTLWDRGKNSVRATVRGQTLSIPVGHEMLVGVGDSRTQARDNVGRRNIRTLDLGEGVSVVSSEVSLVTLMQSNGLVKQVLKSPEASDRAITRKLMKMAATIMTTTGSHGAYSQGRL